MPTVKCSRIPRQRNSGRGTNTTRQLPPIWSNEDPNMPLLRTVFRDRNLAYSTRNTSRLPVPITRNNGMQSCRRQDRPVQLCPNSKLPTVVRPGEPQPKRTVRPFGRLHNNAGQILSSNNLQRSRRNTYEVSDPNILMQMQMLERSEMSNIFDQSPPEAFENLLVDSPEPNNQQNNRRCTYDLPEPSILQNDRRSNRTVDDRADGSQSGSFSMTGTIRLYNMNVSDTQQQHQNQQKSSTPRSQYRASNASGGLGLEEYLENYMDVNMVAPREYAVPGRPYVRIDETRDVATPDSWREMMDNRSSIGSQPRSSQNSMYTDEGQTEMCYPSDESIEWHDSCRMDESFGYAQSSPYEPRSVAPLSTRRTRAVSVDRDYFPPHRSCRRYTYDRNTN